MILIVLFVRNAIVLYGFAEIESVLKVVNLDMYHDLAAKKYVSMLRFMVLKQVTLNIIMEKSGVKRAGFEGYFFM